jgi:PAS domain S-box-containing protein
VNLAHTREDIVLRTPNKLEGWLIGETLLVALGVAVLFWTFRQIEESAAVRQHTHAVLNGMDNLSSALTSAESSQRGYLLTGDKAFLQPYAEMHDRVSSQFEKLRKISVLDAAQRHLDVLAPLLMAELTELTHSIDLRRQQGAPDPLAIGRGAEGKRLMDAIRVEIAGFIQAEENLLTQRENEFDRGMRNLFRALVAVGLLAMLYSFSFVYFMHRENQQRIANLVHAETGRLLALQEDLNKKLQLANTTLQVSEARLAVTLGSIGDGVIATDARSRITFLNPVAEKLTGWVLSEARDRPVAEIFSILNQETRQPATIPVAAALTHGTVQGMANHTVLIARDGSECPIADSCAPIRDPQGQVVGAVLVFRDVTKEYAVQKTLHDSAALIQTILKDKNTALENAIQVADKANLAKSDFLSAMSHELRTPLNAILGFAQLIESGAPPPTPAQKRSLDQILKAGWYLLELINEILDLALIESGKVTLSHEPVSLAEVMLECRAMIEPQAHKRGIGMTFPRFDTPYFIVADRVRIKQVLINLLFNAIKYNKPQGVVTVECMPSAPDSLRISIRDTGAGLNSEQLAQLFQPFNRLGRQTGTEEGTGIGLVVTKRLVELMGGRIGVESTVGTGSVFWIELSLTTAPRFAILADADTLRAQPQAPHGVLRTVLYVEDNSANLELVEQLIARRSDLRLLSAADGHLGIEYARTYLPEVILMDINLPGINGMEAMTILRADPLTAHIPIIALSANAVPRDIEKALEAGFFNYLTKPIKVNQFMEALDLALKFSQTAADRPTKKEMV